MDFSTFELRSGMTFRDKALLRQAFTHRSYVNENRSEAPQHNERLEFLGDAVLELVTTDFLYKQYPDMDEGELTAIRSALVNADTCATVASEIGANEFLLLSKGEARDAGRARQVILANTLEALIGALYLDQGYEAAKEFILARICSLAEDIVSRGAWIDAKSLFQARAQEEESVTPSYKTIKESGPDHDKRFQVGVFLNTEKVAEGEGKSKQDAEQEAARNALKARGWK